MKPQPILDRSPETRPEDGGRADRVDLEIIRRYTDQPERMPDDVRADLERALGDRILLYALADLDPSLRLIPTWIAIGGTRVALWRPGEPTRSFERSRAFLPRRSRR